MAKTCTSRSKSEVSGARKGNVVCALLYFIPFFPLDRA